MRILILPKYARKAASTRYRFLQFLPALERAGIVCDVEPLFGDRYLEQKFETGGVAPTEVLRGYGRRALTLRQSARYDLMLVYFEFLPYLPRWFERLCTRSRVPYVLDLDDAVFLQYEGAASRLARWLAGDKMTHVFGDAALVMAGNDFLAARARQAAARVEVVPTVVDTDRYRPGTDRGPADGFTIGWMGSPSTAEYLNGVSDPLRDVCRAAVRSRVVLVGAGRAASLPGVPVELRRWSEESEVSEITRFDVGIMPLPDTPWARGKCGFKLIQYMACGIPVVASPVGVNQQIVEHGVNGFLAPTAKDWVECLERLREDPGLRHRMGEAGRATIEDRYSLRALAPRVVALLRQAGETGAARASRRSPSPVDSGRREQ